MSAAAHVHAINTSDGGVPKRAVPEARVTKRGLVGDRQGKPGIHGGIYRAVSLFALEAIEALAAEGHPIAPGSTGENLTLAALDWHALAPGMQVAIGSEVILELTSYATPCVTIAGAFADGDFSRLHHKKHPGRSRLYAQVLSEGVVRRGDPVRVQG